MKPFQPTRQPGKRTPIILLIAAGLVLAAALFGLSQVSRPVSANFDDYTLVNNTYALGGTRIDPSVNCVFCHTSSIPNLNPYGTDYFNNGRKLLSSLRAIEGLDSDGDGWTNIQEINARTFPGNPNDHPAPPTATSVPPTATKVPPTATSVPPTATKVPPTATSVPPTATKVPPTATGVPPTATNVPPTATTIPPTATKLVGATSAPTQGATATKAATFTRTPTKAGTTPTIKPTISGTPTPVCIRDREGTDGSRRRDDDHRRNRCPIGFHEDPRELEKETMLARLREIYSRSASAKTH